MRFVELCKFYSGDESFRGMPLIDRMLPLDEWEPADGAEMEAMLEKAAKPHEAWGIGLARRLVRRGIRRVTSSGF